MYVSYKEHLPTTCQRVVLVCGSKKSVCGVGCLGCKVSQSSQPLSAVQEGVSAYPQLLRERERERKRGRERRRTEKTAKE